MALLNHNEAEQVADDPWGNALHSVYVREASWTFWSFAEHLKWQKFVEQCSQPT